MLSVRNRFARTYAEARHRFHLAAELNGSKVKVYKHPMTGPNGEEMASDVVFLGNIEAKAVMVVTSGVHGPELFCGSGAQIDALLDLAKHLGLDPAAVRGAAPLVGLKKGGLLVVNSELSPTEAAARWPGRRIVCIPAKSIALKHKLGPAASPLVNTAMAGEIGRAHV